MSVFKCFSKVVYHLNSHQHSRDMFLPTFDILSFSHYSHSVVYNSSSLCFHLFMSNDIDPFTFMYVWVIWMSFIICFL